MLKKTDQTTPHRLPDRVVFDRDAAYAILDEAPLCHVSFVDGDGAVTLPTIHWRIGDQLYFHGSRASRMGKIMASGQRLCVTVTLLDGLVMARSAFHHSMNFRSVVLFGPAREIMDLEEKKPIFDALMDKVAPGRRSLLRPTTDQEANATRVLAMTIDEGSVKTRQGPPSDDAEDLSWPVWAGVVPMSLQAGAPIADAHVPEGLERGRP